MLIQGDHPQKEQVSVSFEFFPPKTDGMSKVLWRAFKSLIPLCPVFVSVTYGAGGTTRTRTHEIVLDIRRETDVEPAAHITCIGSTQIEIKTIARDYLAAGVNHIVALRGDWPRESKQVVQPEGDYKGSVELIRGLREIGDFVITAAAYPEPHPDSMGMQSDIEHLKRKFDAGAQQFITQFFFDNDCFFRFSDAVLKAGIQAPIIPGILPIANFEKIVRFSKNCGATVPKSIGQRFQQMGTRPDDARKLAVEIAAEQCLGLVSAGIENLHFYTLNRADLVSEICHLIGVRGDVAQGARAGIAS